MICDNCIKKDVCIYRDNSEICGEDYHEFVADFDVLKQVRAEQEALITTNSTADYSNGVMNCLDIIDKYRENKRNQESNDNIKPHRSIVWTPEDSLYVEQGMLYD